MTWSWTALQTWRTCPRRYGYGKTLPTPLTYAQRTGIGLHRDAVNYLNGAVAPVPDSLNNFRSAFRELRRRGAQGEVVVSLNREWKTVPNDSADVWLKARMDAVVSGLIVELKSGRCRPEYDEQAKFYAAVAMSATGRESGAVEIWYLETGICQPYQFNIHELGLDIAQWDGEAEMMLAQSDEQLHANPKYQPCCLRCPYAKQCASDGG
jgi:hypothetical protein